MEATAQRQAAASHGDHDTSGHPLAIEAMREVGIDITGHRSKTLDEFAGENFDYVVTVCDRANESCPIFPGATERIHWSFDDPTAVTGTEEQQLRDFRTVRAATFGISLAWVAGAILISCGAAATTTAIPVSIAVCDADNASRHSRAPPWHATREPRQARSRHCCTSIWQERG